MKEPERQQYIKKLVAGLYAIHGNRKFNPDTDESHNVVLESFVRDLGPVPNNKLEGLFIQAQQLPKLPKAWEVLALWRPPQTAQSQQTIVSPFRPDFTEWLAGFSAMSWNLYAKNQDKQYRNISNICDQAHLPSAGARGRLQSLASTAECIYLMYDWFFQAQIPLSVSSEVAEMLKKQQGSAYDGVKRLESLVVLKSIEEPPN